MSFKIDQLEVDSAAARRRPIEVITENGFSIVRADEIGGNSPAPVDTYVFRVRDPHGSELEIRVGIDRRAINEIMLAGRGRILTESSYWIACAERHLADYLWEHDDYPPEATLRVETLTPRDLNLVHRWEMS